MWTIYLNKDEDRVSREKGALDFDICIKGNNRCMKGKYLGIFRVRILEIISGIEKGVWERR